ncbi:MAG TPA: hypothetical protein PLD84_05535 [Chitinophagales bacterium]|nr:hypothetical protein [Chitinophagales bacterium]
MIARIWHGKTEQSDFERYSDFLKEVAIPDYKKTAGLRGLTFLRKFLVSQEVSNSEQRRAKIARTAFIIALICNLKHHSLQFIAIG